MAIATVSPLTGETLETFEPLTPDEIETRIAKSHAAARESRATSFAERARLMRASADLLEGERDDVARMMTTEMGKTYSAAQAEASKCAKAMRFYAEHAERFLADEPADADAVGAKRAYARYQPLGVVLAVMPWNFPLWQVVRFAAPALMAGNTGLLKHSSNVPQTALYIEELFRRGGFPEGSFQTLLVGSGAIEGVLRDPRVAAATLTGSEAAGRSVAGIAGSEVMKTVLELGGSDPFVVMPSADLDQAAEEATAGRVRNNGQSCISAKRFIVHADVYDDFTERFVEKMQALEVGDPMEASTDVGPLATAQGRADVEEYVDDAVKHGAQVLCGGARPDRTGWFYPPTVIAGVIPEMRMYHEEVFGPVAALFRVDNLDEAINLANDTSFGLGANAWTTDANEQERFIADLESGQVFVNGVTTSYPDLPFGGVKNSGYGRELSEHGIREFCNLKTVWIGA